MATKEEQERERELAAALRKIEFEEDTKWVMGDKRGRRFIARLMKTYGEDITSPVTSFTGNSTTFKLEGMREAAKILQSNIIRIAPKFFMLLLTENFINLENTHDRRE